MTDFGAVRQLVDIRQAAEMYGLEVDRAGTVRCIFHGDNNPSMKLYDDHFHCYACGAHGDVTDLTAQLFELSKNDAADKLCADFGISLTRSPPAAPIRKRELSNREKALLMLDILTDYICMLRYFREHYAPFTFETNLSTQFVESLQNLEYAEYLWDSWFDCTDDERAEFFTENIGQFRRYYDSLKRHGFLRPDKKLSEYFNSTISTSEKLKYTA